MYFGLNWLLVQVLIFSCFYCIVIRHGQTCIMTLWTLWCFAIVSRFNDNLSYGIPEEIGIDSPDEREVMLSEIYRRFHPEEEDMFEMEIQGTTV